MRDQRERLRDDAKMMRLAHQDSLTRLANRLHFTETLAGRFLLPRCGEDSFALLMLDLDRFKAVNDTLGHGMGDELLRRVAVRLTRAVREDDLIARLGGDEFAVLASVGDDLAQIRAIAENILDLVSRPFVIDGHVHRGRPPASASRSRRPTGTNRRSSRAAPTWRSTAPRRRAAATASSTPR